MKRLIISIAAGLALAAIPEVSALAQTPAYCTDQVYVEDGLEFSAENVDLINAMNALDENGYDSRALFLSTLQGAPDVPTYERETLRSDCPELFDGSEPKQDLIMLIVAVDDHAAGTVYGDRIGRFHNENYFSSVSDSSFRAGNYVGGLARYFELLTGRAAQVENSPTVTTIARPATTVAANNTSSVRGDDDGEDMKGEILIGFATLAGLVLLIVLVVWGNSRRKFREYKTKLQADLDKHKGDYTTLTLDSTNSSSQMLDLNQLIDQLPDSDDDELKAMKERINKAVANGREVLDKAQDQLDTARSRDDLDNAYEFMEQEVRSCLSEGMHAMQAIGPALADIKAKQDKFPGWHAESSRLLEEVKGLCSKHAEAGFKTEAFSTENESCRVAYAKAMELFEGKAVLSASDLLEEHEARLIQLQLKLTELPKVPGELAAEAERLDQVTTELTENLKAAEDILATLGKQYHKDDSSDLQPSPDEAKAALAEATQHVADSRRAADMQIQDFDGAHQHLEEAGNCLDKVKRLNQSIVSRQQELAQLKEGLPSTLDELKVEADGLLSYIDRVEEDVDADTQRQADVHVDAIRNLEQALASNHLSLLDIDRKAKAIDEALDTCLAAAKSQHQAREQFRDQIKEARRKAKSRFDEAGQYQRYASNEYSQAGRFFSGVIRGMTLEQQLAHWQHAYQAADNAYDEGKDGYDDAHRPTYTSHSSIRSSGGSSGHSFSRPSRPSSSSRGGSSGHRW